MFVAVNPLLSEFIFCSSGRSTQPAHRQVIFRVGLFRLPTKVNYQDSAKVELDMKAFKTCFKGKVSLIHLSTI